MADFVQQHASAVATGATHDFDPAVRRRLAALGYLSTAEGSDSTVAEALRTDGIAPRDRVSEINLSQRLRRLLSQGQFKMAEQTLLRLLDTYPDHAFYQSKLALAYLGQKKLDAAVQLVDATTAIETAHSADYLDVAAALFAADEQAQALAMARRISESVETAAVYLVLAGLYDQADDPDAAATAIDQALQLDPENLVARLKLANRQLGEARYEEAGQLLITLLTAYPIHPEANLLFARMLDQTSFSEQALTRLDRSLRFWPGSCKAHLLRLELLVKGQQTSRIEVAHVELKERCQDEETLSGAASLVESHDAI